MPIGIDDSCFPLILQDWGTHHTDADIRDFCARQEVIIRRALQEGARMINVSVGGMNMSASDRKLIADWIKTLPPGWDAKSLGVFAVVNSALARGALTALKWMSPSLSNVTFVGSLDEGLNRACAAYRAAGLPIPQGVERLRLTG